MSNEIKLTCPRCKHKWEKSLSEMEHVETIYRGEKEKPNVKVTKYRAQYPNDGTYVIIEAEED